ncbi:hypothetical protein EBU95_03870 [bacterium]|nr:hypothetical protein [bacterium]
MAGGCCYDKKQLLEMCKECQEEIVYSGMSSLYTVGGDFIDKKDEIYDNSAKCECGSDFVNGPGHSNWCPKWKK